MRTLLQVGISLLWSYALYVTIFHVTVSLLCPFLPMAGEVTKVTRKTVSFVRELRTRWSRWNRHGATFPAKIPLLLPRTIGTALNQAKRACTHWKQNSQVRKSR